MDYVKLTKPKDIRTGEIMLPNGVLGSKLPLENLKKLKTDEH